MYQAQEVNYRVRLSEGFLAEARQDIELTRWRSCVDNCQLAVENAAKAVLALMGPVGRTHNPAFLLRQALKDQQFSAVVAPQVETLAAYAELLGPDVHIESDYGSESDWRTPWDIFDDQDARDALTWAEHAVVSMHSVVEGATGHPLRDS